MPPLPFRSITFVFALVAVARCAAAEPLAGTKPLEMQGDLADQMVAGIDRFLLGKIDESVAQRTRHWQRDVSSAKAYNASVAPNRARLAKIIGARRSAREGHGPGTD